MEKTNNLNVKNMIPLIAPRELKEALPITPAASDTVVRARREIQNILSGQDKRLLVISGPCSIHDEKAALEYAERLMELKREVADTLCIIMRVYFEKPRTTTGWKGLINDPFMDDSHNIVEGLKKARRLLLDINEMGMPAGTEMLDPITPQYIAGLISWAAIGARTTESQTHREMASGLSMPVGFKNGTDGSLTSALNALQAAGAAQSFIGINDEGHSCIVNTTGNPWCHIVLRGGVRPNYDPISIDDTRSLLKKRNLRDAIMVDCSHANSGKKFKGQAFVWKNIIDQRLEGNPALIGLMLESNLCEGSQKIPENLEDLVYGVSITDECISYETTEMLIRSAHEKLARTL